MFDYICAIVDFDTGMHVLVLFLFVPGIMDDFDLMSLLNACSCGNQPTWKFKKAKKSVASANKECPY